MDNVQQEIIKNKWKAFQEGDKVAFAWIYEKYVDVLYNYGYSLTPDEALIEDTIQDLFISLWRAKENLKVPPSVKNYLIASYRHLLFRKLSQERRKLKIESQLSVPAFDSIPFKGEDDSKHQFLKKAISRLTLRQQEALFLRFYEKATYPQISEILNITIKAAYKLVARSINSMRENF